jgi:hypothetical protein
MGSPLSLVIANFYMEVFEEMVLDRAPHMPLCWFHYVDDTFVIWPHGPDRLRDFLDHLNSVHQSIQFTMETATFPSWMSISTDLGHKVYCKPTHANLYLNSNSYHHPSNKHAILSTLVHRARPQCDQDSLHGELVFLDDIFRQNGYTEQYHKIMTYLHNYVIICGSPKNTISLTQIMCK